MENSDVPWNIAIQEIGVPSHTQYYFLYNKSETRKPPPIG